MERLLERMYNALVFKPSYGVLGAVRSGEIGPHWNFFKHQNGV
jgi:hypothetical protein